VKLGMMLDDTKKEYSRSSEVLVPMLGSSMNQVYTEYNVFQKLRRMVEYIHLLQL
jgi:hypothetical protein